VAASELEVMSFGRKSPSLPFSPVGRGALTRSFSALPMYRHPAMRNTSRQPSSGIPTPAKLVFMNTVCPRLG